MQLARMAVQKNRLPVLHLKLRFFASHHHRDAEPGRNDCAVRGFAAGSEHNASYLAGVKPCRHRRWNICCNQDNRLPLQMDLRKRPAEDGTDQPYRHIVQIGSPLAEILVINLGKSGGIGSKSA